MRSTAVVVHVQLCLLPSTLAFGTAQVSTERFAATCTSSQASSTKSFATTSAPCPPEAHVFPTVTQSPLLVKIAVVLEKYWLRCLRCCHLCTCECTTLTPLPGAGGHAHVRLPQPRPQRHGVPAAAAGAPRPPRHRLLCAAHPQMARTCCGAPFRYVLKRPSALLVLKKQSPRHCSAGGERRLLWPTAALLHMFNSVRSPRLTNLHMLTQSGVLG